jgi:hypothetical protein
MAIASLPELTPEQQQTAVILARLAARREVKRQRQRQGIKGLLPHSTLARLGNEWLAANPQLYAEAAADPIVQNLQHSIRRRTADLKQELVCRSQVQNGGPR